MTAAIGKVLVCLAAGTPCATSVLLSSGKQLRHRYFARLWPKACIQYAVGCSYPGHALKNLPSVGNQSAQRGSCLLKEGRVADSTWNEPRPSLARRRPRTEGVPSKCGSGCGEGGCPGVGVPSRGSAACRRSIKEPICKDMFCTTGCYSPCASKAHRGQGWPSLPSQPPPSALLERSNRPIK